jgi:hypothetical protein
MPSIEKPLGLPCGRCRKLCLGLHARLLPKEKVRPTQFWNPQVGRTLSTICSRAIGCMHVSGLCGPSYRPVYRIGPQRQFADGVAWWSELHAIGHDDTVHTLLIRQYAWIAKGWPLGVSSSESRSIAPSNPPRRRYHHCALGYRGIGKGPPNRARPGADIIGHV